MVKGHSDGLHQTLLLSHDLLHSRIPAWVAILVAGGMVTGAERAKAIVIPTLTANLVSFVEKTIARTQKISQMAWVLMPLTTVATVRVLGAILAVGQMVISAEKVRAIVITTVTANRDWFVVKIIARTQSSTQMELDMMPLMTVASYHTRKPNVPARSFVACKSLQASSSCPH